APPPRPRASRAPRPPRAPPRRPRPPLSPYTTLFRSEIADVLISGGRIDAVGTEIASPPGAESVEAEGCVVLPGLVDLHTHLREPDRKSTRLNSSHVSISYAVFCLKKQTGEQAQGGRP